MNKKDTLLHHRKENSLIDSLIKTFSTQELAILLAYTAIIVNVKQCNDNSPIFLDDETKIIFEAYDLAKLNYNF
jgi:hypothetical protein